MYLFYTGCVFGPIFKSLVLYIRNRYMHLTEQPHAPPHTDFLFELFLYARAAFLRCLFFCLHVYVCRVNTCQ